MGLTRKAVYVICASVGALVFVWVVLFAIRRYNLHRKRKKLQVVYSVDSRRKNARKKSGKRKSGEKQPREKQGGEKQPREK